MAGFFLRQNLRQAPQKERWRKICVTLLLCDPDWCVHKSDVQYKGDANTYTTGT